MDRLDAMRAFLRTVETGSFTEAARGLGATQSAVSKQIAGLEAALGVQLLARSTRAVRPTEAGDRYYEAARAAVEAAEAAAESVATGTELSGIIRLGCPISFGQMVIAPRIGPFLHAHPKLELELIVSDSFLDPVEQGADLVIRVGALRDSALRARRLGTARRALVASPAYLAARGAPASLDDIPNHDCIVYTRLSTGRFWPFGDPAKPRLVPIAGRVRTDSSTIVRDAALAGLGVVLAPLWLVAADLACGRLVPLLPEAQPVPLPIHSVAPPRRFAPRRETALLDHLAEAFRADPATAP